MSLKLESWAPSRPRECGTNTFQHGAAFGTSQRSQGTRMKTRRTLEDQKQTSESPDRKRTNIDWGIAEADYVKVEHSVRVKKGQFLRLSEDQSNPCVTAESLSNRSHRSPGPLFLTVTSVDRRTCRQTGKLDPVSFLCGILVYSMGPAV